MSEVIGQIQAQGEISGTVEVNQLNITAEIIATGPRGEKGEKGDGGDLNYVHYQSTPSEKWLINHNLGKYPSVSIVNSAGSVVVGDVVILDENNVEVSFSGSFSGIAYIN